ncbi:hypothetical protein DUNSADRAFT_3385 [Dunaliella salina]|uniref:Encoded protein n=1 Tax=Dunaliella salina TaxID=3046 RepID=A0ABQ7FVG1_DUNSA|nr:hypothetical protein DUNSADRAFT_3385 [Dunaliella salina]|eukprot:KAF5826371.1 hypothetical protein DUNSADRAFT_3385 [Dunaliella salina]
MNFTCISPCSAFLYCTLAIRVGLQCVMADLRHPVCLLQVLPLIDEQMVSLVSKESEKDDVSTLHQVRCTADLNGHVNRET